MTNASGWMTDQYGTSEVAYRNGRAVEVSVRDEVFAVRTKNGLWRVVGTEPLSAVDVSSVALAFSAVSAEG